MRLRAINGWTTISEWAVRVGELYPDVLEKTEQQAKAYDPPSTGLREIAARISSLISRTIDDLDSQQLSPLNYGI